MKVLAIITIAGLVWTGLAGAIPGLAHQKLHQEKRDISTETVFTTFYQTIVWVDSHGKIINTEINTPATGTAITHPKAKATASLLPPASNSVSALSSTTSAEVMEKPNTVVSPDMSSSLSPIAAQPTPVDMNTATTSLASPQPSSSAGLSMAAGVAPDGMGICYDMIASSGQCKSQATANTDFKFLKSQGYGIVHIYDIGCPVGDFASAAAQNGLQLLAGINQISNLQSDLGKLISMLSGQWGVVNTIYIGNELVNNNIVSAAEVAGAVTQGRGILQAAGYSGNVITIDTFNVMQSNPTICSTSDYCAANAHAYFDPNTVAENAGVFVLNAYNAVKAGNSGKNVIITESGWPWQGSCNGQACPSADNQRTAMNSIMKSFSGMPGNIFLFQAYDAGYKQPGPDGVEQFFGIYDLDHYTGDIGAS